MTKSIPLRNRAGDVIAVALVDDADYEWLSQWRWNRSSYGYAIRTVEVGGRKTTVRMHRVILGLDPGLETDHINRNRLDNRRANLRAVTRAQNAQNVGSYAGSLSPFRGVFFNRTAFKWQAGIKYAGRVRHLGSFDTQAEAAEAASRARRLLMPFSVEDPTPPPTVV